MRRRDNEKGSRTNTENVRGQEERQEEGKRGQTGCISKEVGMGEELAKLK